MSVIVFKETLKYQWIMFCQNTSLHGWKYTVLHKTRKGERLTWIIICLTAITLAIYLVLTAWFQYQASPIITVTLSTQFPVYQFEFPAVTICSLNRISKKLAYKVAKDLIKPNGVTVESLAANLTLLFQLINNDNLNLRSKSYKILHEVLNQNKMSIEEVFKLISPSCDMILQKCIWKGKIEKCNDIFETVKTMSGYCCSFNYFALKNVSLSRFPKTPRRVSANGYDSGLEVLVNSEPSDYFATQIPSTGFRVFIHNPYDFPDSAVPFILCEINTYNFIGVNPTIITASEHLRKRSFLSRKCLFPDEQDLLNFVVYNFHNCMVECNMFLTLNHCGCVPFYLYNQKGAEDNFKICTLEDISCVSQHEHLIFNSSYLKDFNDQNNGKCECLPDCESAFYMPEVSKGFLDATYSTKLVDLETEWNSKNLTAMKVFFNDLVGTRHSKESVFRWHTLMGYYGGILGLLTGFSFISLIEIVYFTTIRLAADLINARNEIGIQPGKAIRIKFLQVHPKQNP